MSEEWKNMKKPCKITVECVGGPEVSMPFQREAWWDEFYGERAKLDAIENAIHDMGGWNFRPIEWPSNYKGWSRMTVNISDHLCVMANCGNRKSDMNEGETICWECSDGMSTAQEQEKG